MLPNNFMVADVCNSNLYLSSFWTLIDCLFCWREYEWEDSWLVYYDFSWYTRHNVEYLTPNKNHQVIETHHFTLELLLWLYCFCSIVSYSSNCNKCINFEEKHVCLSGGNLCGSFVLLFFVFMDIVSILIFGR